MTTNFITRANRLFSHDLFFIWEREKNRHNNRVSIHRMAIWIIDCRTEVKLLIQLFFFICCTKWSEIEFLTILNKWNGAIATIFNSLSRKDYPVAAINLHNDNWKMSKFNTIFHLKTFKTAFKLFWYPFNIFPWNTAEKYRKKFQTFWNI